MKGIVFGNGKFGYKSLPKNASTSIKAAIYEVEVGEAFCKEKAGMHVHTYMKENKNGDLCTCEKRFVVIRDPVKRFLSAYKNRVLYHNELSEPFIKNKFLKYYWDIPHFTPGLGQFIDDLEDYLLIKPIFHHCRPMVEHLGGKSPEHFTHVYKFENINRFEEDLSELTGKEVVFGHRQTGGKKYSICDLTKMQMKKLIEFYKVDYELLEGFYSVDELWNEWSGKRHDPEVPRTYVKKKKVMSFVRIVADKFKL
jgi:hypothetical protein